MCEYVRALSSELETVERARIESARLGMIDRITRLADLHLHAQSLREALATHEPRQCAYCAPHLEH